MEALLGGQELDDARPHVRSFYRQLPFVVGASRGQLTKYIYVEWHQNGSVHGRPITADELGRKGAIL